MSKNSKPKQNSTSIDFSEIDMERLRTMRAALASDFPSLAIPNLKDLRFDELQFRSPYYAAIENCENADVRRIMVTEALRHFFKEGYKYAQVERESCSVNLRDIQEDANCTFSDPPENPISALTDYLHEHITYLRDMLAMASDRIPFTSIDVKCDEDNRSATISLKLARSFLLWLDHADYSEVRKAEKEDIAELGDDLPHMFIPTKP